MCIPCFANFPRWPEEYLWIVAWLIFFDDFLSLAVCFAHGSGMNNDG
jgi:hypothetical protein